MKRSEEGHAPECRHHSGEFQTVPDGVKRSAEERQYRLTILICDTQRLDAKLLLNLQGLKLCRLFIHVRIDQSANTAADGIHQ